MQNKLFLYAVDLLIIAMLFLVVGKFLGGIEDNTLFEREYLSKDAALLMNAVYASSFDSLHYIYSFPKQEISLDSFSVSFRDQRISVRDISGDQPDPSAIYYPYASSSYVQSSFMPSFQRPIQMIIENSGLEVSVSESFLKKPLLPECDAIIRTFSDQTPSRHLFLMLDPGEGFSDLMWSDAAFTDKTVMWQTTRSWDEILIGNRFSRVEFSSSYSSPLPLEARLHAIEAMQPAPDILLSFHPIVFDHEVIPIIINYNQNARSSLKSKYIACLLYKEFTRQSFISTVESQPEFSGRRVQVIMRPWNDIDSLPNGHPMMITTIDKGSIPSVLIQFGNVMHPRTDTLFSNRVGIALLMPRAIDSALEGYNG